MEGTGPGPWGCQDADALNGIEESHREGMVLGGRTVLGLGLLAAPKLNLVGTLFQVVMEGLRLRKHWPPALSCCLQVAKWIKSQFPSEKWGS